MAQKQYGIVAPGISIAIIDLEKAEKTKEKIVMQTGSIYTGIKIESIFWLSILKKNWRILLLVIKVDDAMIAHKLIEKGLVLDHILHGCMRYNPVFKIK